MDHRTQIAFLVLVVAQSAHSLEEYTFALYEVFPPARFVSSLVSADLATGFVVLNSAFVSFGIWCYALPVRAGWPSARALAWVWIAIALLNGVTHPVMALRTGGYFPGVGTAPVLLAVAIVLAVLLRSRTSRSAAAEPPLSG